MTEPSDYVCPFCGAAHGHCAHATGTVLFKEYDAERGVDVTRAGLPPTRNVVESTTPGRLGVDGVKRALDVALLKEQARPAPAPRACTTCGGYVRWVDAPTGGWWAHDVHPPDEHDAAVASVQDQVIADLEARKKVGLERYGTLLYPFNGRDMARDAYEEALDLCVYLRGLMDELDARGER